MRLLDANGRALLLNSAGDIHVPFSLFLNANYDNPNSRGAVSHGLRLLDVFVRAFDVNLPRRALEGISLHPTEINWLTNLAYRPLAELELMSHRMLVRLAKSKGIAPRDRPGAVAASTASARLVQIAEFLRWYFQFILDPRLPSTKDRAQVKDRYDIAVNALKSKIRGGNSKHATQVRSLPVDRFKQLMSEVWARPEEIFRSDAGARSRTLQRDRAVFYLACEGMRPGAIGNLMVEDFLGNQIIVKDNVGRRGEAATSGTPVQKGARSNIQSYNSEFTITLWPWTTAALREYISSERAELLARRLHNPSKGFLFLESLSAGPIRNRKTISTIFQKMARRMSELGLLAKQSGDGYVKTKAYKLVAYTLRHSAATLYVLEKGASDQTRSEMKDRFGWTAKSTMAELYARRANMDSASLDTGKLWEDMKAERCKRNSTS